MRKMAYISGAYTAKTNRAIKKNIALARKVGLAWWKKGYAVLVPHLNTSFMEEDGVSYEELLDGDKTFVKKADIIVFLPNWKESKGAKREHEWAIEFAKVRYYEK